MYIWRLSLQETQHSVNHVYRRSKNLTGMFGNRLNCSDLYQLCYTSGKIVLLRIMPSSTPLIVPSNSSICALKFYFNFSGTQEISCHGRFRPILNLIGIWHCSSFFTCVLVYFSLSCENWSLINWRTGISKCHHMPCDYSFRTQGVPFSGSL